MIDKPTGGYAFPWCGDLNQAQTIGLGMTLRDYFAGKAMQALMQSHGRVFGTDLRDPANENLKVARIAYAMADAMIQERDQ